MPLPLRSLRHAVRQATTQLHVFEEAGAVAAGDVTEVQNHLRAEEARLTAVRVLLDVAADAALTIQARSDAGVIATFTVPNGVTEYDVPAATLGAANVDARETLNFNVTADGGAAEGLRIEATTMRL